MRKVNLQECKKLFFQWHKTGFCHFLKVEHYRFRCCVRCAGTSRTGSITAYTAATDVPASSREALERRSPTHASVRMDHSSYYTLSLSQLQKMMCFFRFLLLLSLSLSLTHIHTQTHTHTHKQSHFTSKIRTQTLITCFTLLTLIYFFPVSIHSFSLLCLFLFFRCLLFSFNLFISQSFVSLNFIFH